MDEKLRKSLTAIICDTVECTEPLDCDMAKTCPYVIDGLPQLEQAFRDNGWVEPQQLGMPTPYRPTMVCLCGSTRFSVAFRDAQLRETLAGKIVLTIGCNMRSDTEIFGHMSQEELDETKRKLDELHLRKIDMADEVLILDVDGYIGHSTTNELHYAQTQGKRIRFLSQESPDLARSIEPRQPVEGELATNPYQWALDQYTVNDPTYADSVIMGKGFKYGSEAQLDHDKATMVTLPSEDELALWLCDHLNYTSRGLAQELLLRCREEKP